MDKEEYKKRCNYRLYFKHDGCTMLLFKNITIGQALYRKRILSKMYNDWHGHFIVTK
uniref:Uncharacterized protein n=1 Tax=Dulem virus 42 TaxID=3145760 RepID=A0AAU8BB20_9CAUD